MLKLPLLWIDDIVAIAASCPLILLIYSMLQVLKPHDAPHFCFLSTGTTPASYFCLLIFSFLLQSPLFTVANVDSTAYKASATAS